MFFKSRLVTIGLVLTLTTITDFGAAQDVKETPLVLDASGDPLPPEAMARLGRVANRPGGPIRFLPDGKTMLIAGTMDNTIYLRDGATGKTLRTFAVKGRPEIFDFSPDGKTVALVDRQDNGGGFLLRDIATGKNVSRVHLADGTAPIGAWFSPDGTLLATSRGNKVVAVWETAASKKVCEIRLDTICSQLSFAADGKSFYTSSGRQGLVVDQWETRTGKNLRSLAIADKNFSQAVVSPDGKLMALDGSRPGGLRIFKVADAESGKDLYQADVAYGFRAFSPKGDVLAAADSVLDARTGKPISRLAGGAHNLVFSPDGKRIASNWSSGSPPIWETATGRQLRTFSETHFGPIRDVAVSPDGKMAYAAGMARIHVWDLNRRQLVHIILNPSKVSWDFVTDGRLLASFSGSNLIFWDPSVGKEANRLEGQDQVIAMDLSPDGTTLALVRVMPAVHGPKEIVLQRWDRAAKKELPAAPFKLGMSLGFLNPVHREFAVAFSPDGKLLAANDHRQLFVWQHAGAKAPDIYVTKWTMAPSALRFSPDGRLLAAVCSRECIVWDVQKKEERLRLNFRGIPEPALDDPVHDAVFSPDGRMLLTAHASIRIWEMASGEERWTLKAGATALAMTRDQSLLISASTDSAILLWDMKRLAVDSRWADAKPKPEELEALWTDLAGTPRTAFIALQRLSVTPGETVPFLADRLRPKKVDAELLKKLIAGLGAATFRERETAEAELRKAGDAAEASLRQALRENAGAELRRRVAGLLKQLEGPEMLRALRAVEALERIGSTGARRTLLDLASSPSTRLRQESQSALARLDKRAGAQK
jgi:WD40 repeat protein